MGAMYAMALHAASWVGRISAFAVACLSFYLAFFLYENEEGAWQNRIDDLWISIDDRAKITNSFSTAFFNRVAHILLVASSVIFGKRLVSIQMVAVSTNLSIAGAGLIVLILNIYAFYFARAEFDVFFTVLSLVGFLLFLAVALVAMRFSRVLVSVACCFPLWTVFFYVLSSVLKPPTDLGDAILSGVIENLLEALPAALLFSLLSDAIVVAVIRKLFDTIAASVSLNQVVRSIGILLVVLLAILPAPYFTLGAVSMRANTNMSDVLEASKSWILILNATTGLYCILPLMMLVVVLLHKAIWPTLSRLLYPFSRFRILLNRKAMASIGSLGLAIAFDLERISLQTIMKLFS